MSGLVAAGVALLSGPASAATELTVIVYGGSFEAGWKKAVIEPFEAANPDIKVRIATGLTMEIPSGFEGQVRARSGLALKKGLALANGVGTIDADFRGEVGVILVNLGAEAVTLQRGDRIAQLVVAPVARATFEDSGALAESGRGAGGFGSTGEA